MEIYDPIHGLIEIDETAKRFIRYSRVSVLLLHQNNWVVVITFSGISHNRLNIHLEYII